MIYGIGTDIIEVERVKNSAEKISGFLQKIYTEKEIEYCGSKRNKYENYAARFAAKEAFFKAAGTGWRDGMAFCEVEIKNDQLGKPEICLSGKAKEFAEKNGIKNIFVTLTHIKETAAAFVVLEK
jgi:holo-[acyl-carrier protein] synthase